MRKRTIKHCAKTIFWYLLYLLPIICYLLYMIAEPGTGTNIVSITSFIEQLGINISNNNLVFTTLNEIFGTNGILPFFNDNTLIFIFTYYIEVVIMHLLVDMILFIPKLAHKWLSGVCDNEE